MGKVAYARWPKGPSGKRVTSIWNWGFPINAALSDSAKVATWLFIQCGCKQTQILTSYAFRARRALRGQPQLALEHAGVPADMDEAGDDFIEAAVASMQEDTDPDWRPRVPQWPGVGDIMAIAVKAALVRPADAQGRARHLAGEIDEIMQQ